VSGHIKWTDVRRTLPMDLELWRDIQRYRPGVMRETQSWVKGYIKALEDVIKDLHVQAEVYATSNVVFRTNPLEALGAAGAKVQESLASAQKTLDTINKIMEEPSDSEQGQGGAVRSGPGE